MFDNPVRSRFATFNIVQQPQVELDIPTPKQEEIVYPEYLLTPPTVQPVKEAQVVSAPEEIKEEEERRKFNKKKETPKETPKEVSSPKQSVTDSSLIKIDIEDLLRSEGITSVNGKKIKFGNKQLRAANASFGAKNSNHKKRDPHTGNAMARDISIIGGTMQDYSDFRKILLSNPRVCAYMQAKGWGIINEVTPAILKRTRGTGPHFHFGPDSWARRTWNTWLSNPNIDVTKAV